MHRRVARQDDAVLQGAMAADHRPVGEDATAADDAIVGDMAIGHQKVVVAQYGLHRVGRAAMDGHLFAEDIVVADFQRGRFVIVLEVLRTFAQDGAGEDLVPPAHCHGAEEKGARANHAIVADGHRAVDHCQGADLDVFAELRLGRDHGSRVNSTACRKGHLATPIPWVASLV